MGVPLMPGPVPKRSSQRRRRNQVSVDRLEVVGSVVAPELGLDDVHPVAAELYASLSSSGQSRWYEPSDWQRARVMVLMLSRFLVADRTNVALYVALQKDMDALLLTEGERRRVRMEIERSGDDPDEVAAVASVRDALRERRERLIIG